MPPILPYPQRQVKSDRLLADDLTETQIKAFRLSVNKMAELAEWDDDLLKLEFMDLDLDGFDLSLTGFDMADIDTLLADEPTEGLTDPDAVPDVPAEPVTVLGDVWLLGRHRLVCGDSTSADAVDKCLAGVKPHLMVTDPPYGVEYDADWRNRALHKDGTSIGARAIGKVMNDDNTDWSEAWALFPGDVAYVWCAPGPLNCKVHDSLVASGFPPRMQIVWAKSQLVIGRGHYHAQHENCWYAVREGKTGHWAGDRKQTSYAGKWVTGFEKAAYRGGCRSLPELPTGTIRHEERYRHHRPASAGICG